MKIDQQVARDLLPLVNDTGYYNSLLSYADSRIRTISKQMETETNIEVILRYQGQIKELRVLLDIRANTLESSR